MTGMRLSERFAMAAEDIRHLQSRSHGTRSAGRHNLQAEPIEWARRVADRFGGDPGVARRARDAGMAEQDLDDAYVRPALHCSTRITIRWLSMSATFNRTTSDTRSPAA